MIQKTKINRDLIAALRVVPTVVNGSKGKMMPSDVLDTHWNFADQSKDGCVCWSTNVKIHKSKVDRIDKIVFFSTAEDWYVMADVVKIYAFGEEVLPSPSDIKPFWCPGEFPEAKNTWIVLKNFRQVNRLELSYKVLEQDVFLSDQVLKQRFTLCYAIEQNL